MVEANEDSDFQVKQKKRNRINHLNTTFFSFLFARAMECNPKIEAEEIPATSRKVSVFKKGRKRDLVRTCCESRALFGLWTSVTSA